MNKSTESLIGVLFLFSGTIKIFNLILFQETIELYNIFPQYSTLFTVLIPGVEIVAGIFLIIGIFRKVAIYTLIPLLLIFIIAIWVNLREGFIFNCGCFGPLNILSEISWRKIIFNIVLLLCLFFILFKDKKKYDLYAHFKVLIITLFFISVLIYIPFSNSAWEYAINIGNIRKIDWKTAISLVDNKNAVLFDARINELYKKEHVPGALSLPVLEFSKYFEKYNLSSANTFIIVYCGSEDCSSAPRTSFKLIARGFKNVFTVTGGFSEWKKYNK